MTAIESAHALALAIQAAAEGEKEVSEEGRQSAQLVELAEIAAPPAAREAERSGDLVAFVAIFKFVRLVIDIHASPPSLAFDDDVVFAVAARLADAPIATDDF